MKYEVTEKQLEKLKKVIQGFIDSALDSLRKMSEDWGLGQMDEYDEVRSVEKIVVDRIVPYTGINVYIDMYVKNDRDYNNVRGEIQYRLEPHFPSLKLFINEIITD
jgi:hypothetical protein